MKSYFSMRCRLATFVALVLAFAALLIYPIMLAAQAAPSGQQATEAKPKTAGEAFKNVQILKDIRQDQLFPSMRYIAAALGVQCDFCHVPNHFESDDKPEKARAREMMKMMFAINTDNFHGHREITCYTCHRGNSHPVGTPTIPNAAAMAAQMAAPNPPASSPPSPPPPGEPSDKDKREADSANPGSAPPSASLPSVDELLAKYTQALGGADAIQKVTTRVEKGTVEIPERNSHSTMEVFRKSPDKALAILHSPVGDIVEGYDGTVAWENRQGHGATEETGDSLNRVKEWAAFFTGLDLKEAYSRSVVNGIEKVGSADAYRVFAFRKGGGMERLYFDTESGLLLRVDTRIDSPLGALPQETDYEDYRAVGGVEVPFTIQVKRIDTTTIYKWESVQANVPIADDRFEKPASVPPTNAQPGGGKLPNP